MPIFEYDDPIHLKHFKDGFPLCWDQDETGTFEGSSNESEVTCKKCLDYLKG